MRPRARVWRSCSRLRRTPRRRSRCSSRSTRTIRTGRRWCSWPRCASGSRSGHPEQAALLEQHRRALREGSRRRVARARRDGAGAPAPSRRAAAGRRGRAARRRGPGDGPRRAADTFEAALDGGDVVGDAARDLGLRTARLWDKLGETDRAEARYLYVLEVDSDNGDALEALDRIYRARGAHAELASVLERRAGIEYDVEREEAALRRGGASCTKRALGDVPGAIAGWRKVLDVDDGDVPALDNLARLHEREEHWHELVTLLGQKVRVEEDAGAQVGLKSRIAAIWAEKIGDLDHAVEAYRDLLDHAPESRAALDALEELERRRGDFGCGAGGARAAAAGRRRRAAADPGLQEAGGARRRQAQVAGRRDRLPARDPDAGAGRAGSERQDARAPRADRSATTISSTCSPSTPIGARRRATRRARLRCWCARPTCGKRSSRTPKRRRRSWSASSSAIRRTCARSCRWRASTRARTTSTRRGRRCSKATELAESAAERAELHFRLGNIEADAGSEEAGEPHWLDAVDADPTHTGALTALEKLARARCDWSRVADLLALRLEQHARRRAQAALRRAGRGLRTEAEAARARRCRTSRRWPRSRPTTTPSSSRWPISTSPPAATTTRCRSIAASPSKLGKGKKSRDLARLNQRIGAIAEKKGDAKLAMEHYNAGLPDRSAAHADDGGARPALHDGVASGRRRGASIARCCCRTSIRRRASPRPTSTCALGEIHEKLGEGPKALGMFERGLELDGRPRGAQGGHRARQASVSART